MSDYSCFLKILAISSIWRARLVPREHRVHVCVSPCTFDCDPFCVFDSTQLQPFIPLPSCPRRVCENQRCLLGSRKPGKHVRVHSIREAQNNAFREATYTNSDPHRTSPAPELQKSARSFLIQIHTHRLTLSLNAWPLSLSSSSSSLSMPDWLCQHHLTGTWTCFTMPGQNTASLRTAP